VTTTVRTVPEQLPSAGPTSKFCGIPATDASGKKIQFFSKRQAGREVWLKAMNPLQYQS